MATLTRQDDKTVIRVLSNKEVTDLISKYEESEKEEAAKKQKAAQK